MGEQRRVRCSENQALADYLLQKKRELADKPKGLSENWERTFVQAYRNLCDTKDSIHTLKDLSQIKGFGKWLLTHMKGYFETRAASSEEDDLPENRVGKSAKARKQYIPQRNSVSYAFLITLLRQTANGKGAMHKEELIDATEASGLSHAPVRPEKGKGKLGRGHSKREWYSGWSCMTKTLIPKGLVAKSGRPAKYMLTVEGREVANECIKRSGLSNSLDTLSDDEVDLVQPYASPKSKENSTGPSRAQTCQVDREGSRAKNFCSYNEGFTINSLDISSDDEVELVEPDANPKSKADSAGPSRAQSCQVDLEGSPAKKFRSCNDVYTLNQCPSSSNQALKAFSSALASDGTEEPRLPPLTFGEAFEKAYEVILILDDRERFTTKGPRSRTIVDEIRREFNIKIEVRRLPVGDCIWIARHKVLETEYVLDFIVERKSVDDMRSSIRDNRYRDQKLRLQRLGLKKMIYILEGDPNQSDAVESIKTACFTTELLEGFDVLRTNGLGETLRKYGHLTKSIYQYYKSRVNGDQSKVAGSCPSYQSFVKRCQDLDKMTISDVFGIQLMQVPEVTEEIAIAVLDMYPTLLSLASAYSQLEGNVSAQEEMLSNLSKNAIGAPASKNIFKLVWGE